MVLTDGIPLVRIVAEYPVKLLLITVVNAFIWFGRFGVVRGSCPAAAFNSSGGASGFDGLSASYGVVLIPSNSTICANLGITSLAAVDTDGSIGLGFIGYPSAESGSGGNLFGDGKAFGGGHLIWSVWGCVVSCNWRE